MSEKEHLYASSQYWHRYVEKITREREGRNARSVSNIEAGELHGGHATVNWGGEIDWVLGLDLPEAGQLVQSQKGGRHVAILWSRIALPKRAGDATRQVSDDRIGFALDEFLWSQLDPSGALAAARPDGASIQLRRPQNGDAGVFAITQRLMR